MSLFNEYQNKNITYLIKYINGVLAGNEGLTENELNEILVGQDELTYPDFIKELTNSMDDPDDNALLFYKNKDEVLLPLCPISIPVRATRAERSWLYYYLQKPEVKLFLDDNTIETLKRALEVDKYNETYPLNDNTFEIRDFPSKKSLRTSLEFKTNFTIIRQAIREKKYFTTENHSANGTIYKNDKLVPFRFEYIKQNGTLCVSAYAEDSDDGKGRSIKLNLLNLHRTKLGNKVANYEDINQKYLKSLNQNYEKKEPLTIKICDHYNGFDRAVYTFANYIRESYRDDKNNIIMKIYYRRFQESELLNKLLFLGSAVTVLGPDDMKHRYVDIIKETLKNY